MDEKNKVIAENLRLIGICMMDIADAFYPDEDAPESKSTDQVAPENVPVASQAAHDQTATAPIVASQAAHDQPAPATEQAQPAN